MTPPVPVRQLCPLERPALKRHFLSLESDDRRLRFGTALSDEALRAYVHAIDSLLRRAHVHARNWGVHELFMHCLAENGAIMHLARKQGMEIVAAEGEADAFSPAGRKGGNHAG